MATGAFAGCPAAIDDIVADRKRRDLTAQPDIFEPTGMQTFANHGCPLRAVETEFRTGQTAILVIIQRVHEI